MSSTCNEIFEYVQFLNTAEIKKFFFCVDLMINFDYYNYYYTTVRNFKLAMTLIWLNTLTKKFLSKSVVVRLKLYSELLLHENVHILLVSHIHTYEINKKRVSIYKLTMPTNRNRNGRKTLKTQRNDNMKLLFQRKLLSFDERWEGKKKTKNRCIKCKRTKSEWLQAKAKYTQTK